MKIPEAIKKAADGMFKWRGVEAMGGKDVLAWVKKNGEPAFAVQGPDLRIQQRCLNGDKSMFNNHGMRLDLSLQKNLGLDARLERRGYQPFLVGGAGQTMGEGLVSADELDQGITSALSVALDADIVHFTLMPMTGKPWNDGQKCTPYYSAKKQKVLCGTKPEGMISTQKYDDRTGGYIKVKGVDFCTIAPTISETEGGVVGEITDDRFFLMHSFNMDPRRNASPPKKVAKAITDCGGLLYPSLAIADVPSFNFGSCCLFARLPLALRVLKPYKERSRGVSPVTVYNTDAWTDVTRDFVGSAASELFDQLTGRWEIQYGSHMMTLGPRLMEDARTRGPEVKVLKSVSQLRSALKRKRSRWHRGMSDVDILNATDTTDLRYPYLEVKVNGILRVPDTFPVATCPGYLRARTREFLSMIGFNGILLTVPVKGALKEALRNDDPQAQWDYAWMVRDAVIAWQEKQDATVNHYRDNWLENVSETIWRGGHRDPSESDFNTPTLVRSNPARLKATKVKRHVGFCPCCGKNFKVVGGLLVDHGYKRPGKGYLEGGCIGVGHKPHETSPELAKRYMKMLAGQKEKVKASLVALPRSTSLVRSQRGEKVTLTRGECPERVWDHVYGLVERGLQAEIQLLSTEMKRVDSLVKTWERKPLKTVLEEEAANQADRDKVKSAAEAKKAEKIADQIRKYQKRIDLAVSRKNAKPLVSVYEDAPRKLQDLHGGSKAISKQDALALLNRNHVWEAFGLPTDEMYAKYYLATFQQILLSMGGWGEPIPWPKSLSPTLAKSNPAKASPRYVYHVTYANRLKSIEENGLSPKAGGVMGRGGYAGHSSGRLFLTDADGVDFWYERAEQAANDLSDNPFEDGFTPVVLRMPMPKTKFVDEPGSSDSGHDAWYVTKRIPVGWKSRRSGHVEIWDGSSWIKIWDWNKIDFLLAYDAEQYEGEELLSFKYQNDNPLAQIGDNTR